MARSKQEMEDLLWQGLRLFAKKVELVARTTNLEPEQIMAYAAFSVSMFYEDKQKNEKL